MDRKIPTQQSWIERIFEKQIDWDQDCENPCFESGVFIAAIAAQHEAEVAEARSEMDEAWQATVDTLKARVAMMAEALEACLTLIDDLSSEDSRSDSYIINAVVAKTNQALSAAPKVVWHGLAQVSLMNDLMLLDDGAEALRELKYPYRVDAILLEWQPKAKQGQGGEEIEDGQQVD